METQKRAAYLHRLDQTTLEKDKPGILLQAWPELSSIVDGMM
jgi:hypothetical protein